MSQKPTEAAAGIETTHQPFTVRPGEGRTYPWGNATQTIKVAAEDTDGHFELWETWLPPGYEGPSAHIHDQRDKAAYVVEGEVQFLVGDRLELAPAGTCLMVPRGAAHTFNNPGSAPARFLWIETKGGREGMFADIAEALPRDAAPDPTVLASVLRKWDTRPA